MNTCTDEDFADTAALIANLAALVIAVAELREAQQRAAQATAARTAASCERWPGPDSCATIIRGPLNPGPKPSESRLNAR